MEDLLRSKGLYKITLGTKAAPDGDEKKDKWENKNDQACGLIGMSISPDLKFHLDREDSLVKAWEKLNSVFGIKNEIWAFQLENGLLTLDPSNFPSIEDYLSKFKTLKLLLEGCNVSKEEDPLIYGILAKLPPTYLVFVSTFHSTREALLNVGQQYKTPSLDTFCDSLVREQEKLLHLGLVKTRNISNKSLVSQQPQGFKNPKKQYPKRNGSKPNNKGLKNDKSTHPNENVAHHNDKANKNKGKKIYKHCNFCDHDGHKESKCFKNMEALEATIKKHNIIFRTRTFYFYLCIFKTSLCS